MRGGQKIGPVFFMKYKNVDSFAHNFVHSFVSSTNYVDGGYIIDDLREAARKMPISISWLPVPKVSPSQELLSNRVIKSIAYFQSWLPQHAEHHEIQLEHIRELRLEMYLLPSYQLRCESVLVDDRDKEHRQQVLF
jgi:hypothetical protein